jgi:hypothetical protein
VRWEKLGRVYAPAGEHTWAQAHAFIPTSLVLDDERVRVYAAFRDGGQVGRVGFVDVDARDPTKVLRVSERPALDIGEPGTFDDSGVSPVSIVEHDGRLLLYYIGWQLGVKVRYALLMGLAESTDGGETFRRTSRVPVLERSDGELFVRSAGFVLKDAGGWRMWYVAGDRWVEVAGKQVPTYNVRHLASVEPARWGASGQVCVELAPGGDEYGFGRPFVLKDEGGAFKMWYSVRTVSKGYRIGYAESADGLAWERKDTDAGIDVSAEGWDSEMVCFACVQPTRHGTYMFYNGNGYGETGFGVAVLRT